MFTSKDLARRIELAQADQNQAFIAAMKTWDPASTGSSLTFQSGRSNFAGAGSPFGQAQVLGLDGPLEEKDLDLIEQHLGQGGGPIRLELTPFADPRLMPTLVERGYVVSELQQVWLHDLSPRSETTQLEIRVAESHEAERWARVVVQGFVNSDALDPGAEAMALPNTRTQGTTCFFALLAGEAIGAGTVALFDGVATLSGASVRTGFRGQGAQRALIAARLEFARAHQAEIASSAAAAGTPSQRNLERCGFTLLYPKVIMTLTPTAEPKFSKQLN